MNRKFIGRQQQAEGTVVKLLEDCRHSRLGHWSKLLIFSDCWCSIGRWQAQLWRAAPLLSSNSWQVDTTTLFAGRWAKGLSGACCLLRCWEANGWSCSDLQMRINSNKSVPADPIHRQDSQVAAS